MPLEPTLRLITPISILLGLCSNLFVNLSAKMFAIYDFFTTSVDKPLHSLLQEQVYV